MARSIFSDLTSPGLLLMTFNLVENVSDLTSYIYQRYSGKQRLHHFFCGEISNQSLCQLKHFL